MVERGERVLFAAQNLIVVDVTTNIASLTPARRASRRRRVSLPILPMLIAPN